MKSFIKYALLSVLLSIGSAAFGATLLDSFTRGGGETSPYPITGHTASNGGTYTDPSGSFQISPDSYLSSTGANLNLATLSTTAPGNDFEVGGPWKYFGSTGGRFGIAITRGGAKYAAGIEMTSGNTANLGIQQLGNGFPFVSSGLTFTAVSGRSYYVVVTANAATIGISVQDGSTFMWLTSTGFDSATRVTPTALLGTGLDGTTGTSIEFFSYPGTQSGMLLDSITLGTVGELTGLSPVASFVAAPTTVPKNHSGNITLSLTGTSTTWSAQTFTASGVTGVTKISQSIVSATSATLVITTGSNTGTLTISDGTLTTTIAVGTGSFSATPSAVTTGSTLTLTLTGTNTVWDQETAAGLFTLSGGTGASIGTPTITSKTAGTVSVVVGSASGTLTITDTSTGATFALTASTGPITVPVTNANIYWSPFVWYSDGGGAMGANNVKASSSYALSTNNGSYLKFSVTGATSDCFLNMDTSMLSGLSSPNIIGWTIDGGSYQTATLTTYSSSLQIDLGTPGSGTHQIDIFWVTIGDGSIDRWNTPTCCLKITGLQIPGAASMAMPAIRPHTLKYDGDSITMGVNEADGLHLIAILLGRALNAEVGVIGFGGQGWDNAAGFANIPSYQSSWDLYFSGHSRLASGALPNPPTYWVINHGRNGSPTTANITSTINGISAAAPSSRIYIVPTFDRTNASTILAATLPSNAEFLDLGVIPEMLLGGVWRSDSFHPNLLGHVNLAAMEAAEISRRISAGSSSGTTGFLY